ncbi:MAG: helix-turn-helix domain-containing protein [Myxococcota bacterium]|nr:helix-turn-helix domain-containing protein [Myxococcota bacterium]
MSTLERELRDLVREIVRDEVKRALSAVVQRDEYLSTINAAALAGVHPDTVRRWIREGRLAEHRAGRELRIRRADLETLLRSNVRDPDELSPEERAARDFG